MRIFVAVTDFEWFSLHKSKQRVEEVNFWRPSPNATFKALSYGEPFLFKLHSPRNFIVGGGFFTKFLQLPVSLAWDAFGEGNGARTLEDVKERIAHYRHDQIGPFDDPTIGCILLDEPFFFDEKDWFPVPKDFYLNTVQGKGYALSKETGRNLWAQVGERLERMYAATIDVGPATIAAVENARFGNPVIIKPRLGQGSFRLMVTDAYNRRCAMTAEKTLPVLEAAHIYPYSRGGDHALSNGLLLRSDLHKLFDLGYITVDPEDRKIVVSSRIREEYENGRHYYALHGSSIYVPNDPSSIPSVENLRYHSEHVFRS
jgi:putative restriction endonuclease